MEVQGNMAPAFTPQVIYIGNTGWSTKETYGSYAAKTAALLGCIQILCSAISLGFEIYATFLCISIGTGIWCSVIFLVTGILSLVGARSKTQCCVIATMVMSIISAVCAGILFSISIAWASFCGYRSRNETEGIIAYSV